MAKREEEEEKKEKKRKKKRQTPWLEKEAAGVAIQEGHHIPTEMDRGVEEISRSIVRVAEHDGALNVHFVAAIHDVFRIYQATGIVLGAIFAPESIDE